MVARSKIQECELNTFTKIWIVSSVRVLLCKEFRGVTYMGIFVEYGRDQTDEEDDLPSGQHTMCTYNNMWTIRGSTQAKPEAGVKILQPIFSGYHLTSTRHRVCFYHVTFVCFVNLFLLIFRLSSPVDYIIYLIKLE